VSCIKCPINLKFLLQCIPTCRRTKRKTSSVRYKCPLPSSHPIIMNFQQWVNRKVCEVYVTDECHKTKHFCWWNVSDDMCGIGDHLGLGLTKSIHCNPRNTMFTFFVPSNLDLWPLDLKFALLVTLVQRYASAKLKVLRLRISRKSEALDGRTDSRRTDGQNYVCNNT